MRNDDGLVNILTCGIFKIILIPSVIPIVMIAAVPKDIGRPSLLANRISGGIINTLFGCIIRA